MMSRSRKKHPFSGITMAASEKADKTMANRRCRKRNAQILRATGDDTALRHERELSDPWLMAKDGKVRFDPARHPELRRK